ncbi:hypothetical protein P9112_012397 [Eukaryota sp. TZLM1-RC]
MSYYYDDDFENEDGVDVDVDVPTPKSMVNNSPRNIEQEIPFESPVLNETLPKRSPIIADDTELYNSNDNVQTRSPSPPKNLPSHRSTGASRRSSKPTKMPRRTSARSSSRNTIDSSSMANRLRIAEQQADRLRRENKALRRKYDSLAGADKLITLENTLKEKNKLIEQLQSEQKVLLAIQQKQSNALAAPDHVSDQLERLNESVRVLKEHNRSLKVQNTNNSQTIQRQVAEIGALREKLDQKKSVQSRDPAVEVNTEDLTILKEKLENSLRELNSVKKSRDSVVKRYKSELNVSRQNEKKLSARVDELESLVNEQNKELSKLRDYYQRYVHLRKAAIQRRKEKATDDVEEVDSPLVVNQEVDFSEGEDIESHDVGC